MDGISVFCHIEAGGFDTGRSICTGNIKLGNAVLLNESSESLAGQCIAFGLCEDMSGYDFHLRYQFGAMCAGLERPCSCGYTESSQTRTPSLISRHFLLFLRCQYCASIRLFQLRIDKFLVVFQ